MNVIQALPPKQTLVRQFRLMQLMSVADRRTRSEARSGGLRAAVYPIHGLEAVCAAVGCLLEPTDYMVSTYRNLGDAIAKGVPLGHIIAEFYGRVGGTSRGKGGAMHLADTSRGFMATSGVVGGGIPIAVGLGLAARIAEEEQVVVCTFGDGATSIGAFHESLNMASLWGLPVLFLCQNNQWGEHTALKEYASQPNLAAKAAAYNMAGVQVDGFDPVALLEQLGAAVDRARSGQGPTLIEAITYRLGPHAGVSDMSYVPKDQLDAAMNREPTPTMRSWMIDNGVLGEDEVEAIEAEIATIVDDAFAFAQASEHSSIADLYVDVYATVERTPGT